MNMLLRLQRSPQELPVTGVLCYCMGDLGGCFLGWFTDISPVVRTRCNKSHAGHVSFLSMKYDTVLLLIICPGTEI